MSAERSARPLVAIGSCGGGSAARAGPLPPAGNPNGTSPQARAPARAGDVRARDRYRAAIREAPSDAALRVEFAEYSWNTGDTTEAEAQMDWLLENAHPREGFRRYYGLKLFDATNFEKAARILGEASREGPPDEALSYCLGASRLETGDFTGAESALRGAIELSPGNAEALRLLGRLLHLTGRSAEAAALLRRAAAADPESAETWLDLAQALAGAGLPSEAERACRRSIERRGDRAAAHLTLAKILRAEGRKDESDAEFAASRALYDQEEERTQRARATVARASRGWELLALNRPRTRCAIRDRPRPASA